METIPCPGCRTELGPEVTACPICLRPRSKYEITRAYATLRAQQAMRRRQPFIIAGYLFVFGAIGGGAYKFRAPLTGAVAAARARFSHFAEEATDPKHLSTHAADAPGTETAPPAAAAPSETAAPASVRSQPLESAPPKPLPAVMPETRRKRPAGDLPLTALDPASQWGLRGTVYDLLTLRPVPGVFLSLHSGSGLGGSVASDPDGRYLMILQRVNSGGYEILNTSPGYVPAVFYESDIPYAQLSSAERRELAESARAGDVHPTPIVDIIGEEAIHRDLFVVPRR